MAGARVCVGYKLHNTPFSHGVFIAAQWVGGCIFCIEMSSGFFTNLKNAIGVVFFGFYFPKPEAD